ncbi:hypothetical protein [Microbacterium sp. BH-3-3-3]|uniref:hypothetical protein n=1 Tax=Microbacterium sp. BH-3-3-3 TaxID=1906742 RepID=UPI0011A30949|nr:hypothetical protein [Microbacterium sp. BH-3-3-3]
MTQPITDEARRQVIAAAQEAAKTAVAEGSAAAAQLFYKGQTITLPVARVNLDYVLLNPGSHRIGGQVQSLPQDKRKLLEEDPLGAPAQKLISDLLRETAGYKRILETLRVQDQRHEGVITDAGVLINANTRAVALRELGQQYINVVILPSDAEDTEFNEIELRLQMAVNIQQDYSFTSQLLFIADLVTSGRTIDEIGRHLRPDLTSNASDLKKAKNEVEQELRLLALVKELVALGGGNLVYTDLDDSRQALIEIDNDYQTSKNKDREAADRVKYAQLTAMLSRVDYRKIRGIDGALIDGYIVDALEEDGVLAGRVQDLLSSNETDSDAPLDGLDFLDDDDDEDDGPGTQTPASFKRLLTLIARADPEGEVSLPGVGDQPDTTVSTVTIRSAIQNAFVVALKSRDQNAAAGDTLSAPTRLLKSAARSIDDALAAFEDVRTDPGFDRDAFDRAVEKLERAYESLSDTLDEQLPEAEVIAS